MHVNFKRIKFRKKMAAPLTVDKASIVFRYTLNGK